MITSTRLNALFGFVLGVLWCILPAAHAQMREQVLNLQAGWNAVYLEVQPLDSDPAAVFTNTPIDTAARYFPRTSPVQFISNPADAPWNEPGWAVWYAPSRPEAAVSGLHAIHGNQAYLVHTPSVCTWRITGKALFQRLRWQADSFNLVGFGIDPQAPPSFARIFSGAGGQVGSRIYRLDVEGNWKPVLLPETTTVKSGEACWVYCSGNTDYQGPVAVQGPAPDGLDFGVIGSKLQLKFLNTGSDRVSVRIEVEGEGSLPLSRTLRDPASLQTSHPILPPTFELSIAPGTSDVVELETRRELMTDPVETRLLKITTQHGMVYWIPVRAQRPN